MPSYIQTTFLIPLNEDSTIGNDRPHPKKRWDWLETELCERFDGYTKSPGIYKGKWRDSKCKGDDGSSPLQYVNAERGT